MPQNLADFAQRGAVTQHARRQRVPKLVCTRRGRGDARPEQSVPNDGSNGTLAEKSLDGRLAAEEHATTGARWTSVAQICGDGRTDIRRQRQGGSMAAVSADHHPSGFPINIPQLETGDFVRTHAESREQEHNRVIAPTDRRPAIETGEQLTNLLVPHRPPGRGG